MPVTKTAKRAERSSTRKQTVNKLFSTKLEIAIRKAKKSKTTTSIISAISLADKAVKKKIIHQNKAGRIKSSLSRLFASPKKKK
ncbi:hypothetical protein A2382_04910 [Candidatus Woesebacteria bacterium RIFOXYB1_FULL_38_16]|uniref:Small ribosomal subunit protein bS20 n=1 Tax=Candidatus Woesebacteria bacterium RIFOXYB1_FULL_38_16 TaxID=1802538 RepID=A0A1F8CW90_9BACT|nr:MAG: hypothetical protein A2191_00250 [Candidatus Woesebacteria bacterium RIFOXYA1_FULL_38_9]OGM79998.1 MAG: hypothetical protein A2382_04910 [Candidatus Woesebacteria bacterium RIFOXYB1_FULL_38_16]